ncbi:MAG: twin transmembrane helix small protein [Ectothiorhodospiraceae bacterium]
MDLAIKIVVIVAMFAIVASLLSGAVFLVRDESSSRRVVRALTWRISLSVGLFVGLLILVAVGAVEPGGPLP